MAKTDITPIKPLTPEKKLTLPFVVSVVLVVVLVGAGVGYAVTLFAESAGLGSEKAEVKAGVFDKKTFPDSTEGVLRKGGLDGEGSFHLERPGGVSQNVYVTSSTVDLSQYLGKRIKVWGQTFQAEKAGWLMDVGYVEIK